MEKDEFDMKMSLIVEGFKLQLNDRINVEIRKCNESLYPKPEKSFLTRMGGLKMEIEHIKERIESCTNRLINARQNVKNFEDAIKYWIEQLKMKEETKRLEV